MKRIKTHLLILSGITPDYVTHTHSKLSCIVLLLLLQYRCKHLRRLVSGRRIYIMTCYSLFIHKSCGMPCTACG